MKHFGFSKKHRKNVGEISGRALRSFSKLLACFSDLAASAEQSVKKVDKECFAPIVDGAPSTAPSSFRETFTEKPLAHDKQLFDVENDEKSDFLFLMKMLEKGRRNF